MIKNESPQPSKPLRPTGNIESQFSPEGRLLVEIVGEIYKIYGSSLPAHWVFAIPGGIFKILRFEKAPSPHKRQEGSGNKLLFNELSGKMAVVRFDFQCISAGHKAMQIKRLSNADLLAAQQPALRVEDLYIEHS